MNRIRNHDEAPGQGTPTSAQAVAEDSNSRSAPPIIPTAGSIHSQDNEAMPRLVCLESLEREQ